jgi:DNA-binding NarL/FixJ family response regulator
MDTGRPDSQRSVLLVGSDLMARERIRSAAAHLEMKARNASPDQLIAALRDEPVDILVLDLDEGRDDVLAELEQARAAGLTPHRVIGYFSHVDRDLGAAAENAGCEAIRRGRFWAELPVLLVG